MGPLARGALRVAFPLATVTTVLMVLIPGVFADTEGITFSLRVSGRHPVFDGRTSVLSVRIRASGSTQTAGIGLTESGWPDRWVSGSPIAVSGETLTGPGRIIGHFASGGGTVDSYAALCPRGANLIDGGGVDVSLPANTTSVLSYRVRIAAPVWPGMRPTIGAYAYVPATSPTGGGVTRALGSQRLIPGGTPGIRVVLAAVGARRGSRGSPASVPLHRTVVIDGSTRPSVAGAEIRLTAKSYRQRTFTIATRRISSTRTDRYGRFRVEWTPETPTTYLITAELRSSPSTYRPGRGCLALTAR